LEILVTDVLIDEHSATGTAAPVNLPPKPRIPKLLQSASYAVSRQWLVGRLRRKHGDVFSWTCRCSAGP
jgi:hypothetical protein